MHPGSVLRYKLTKMPARKLNVTLGKRSDKDISTHTGRSLDDFTGLSLSTTIWNEIET